MTIQLPASVWHPCPSGLLSGRAGEGRAQNLGSEGDLSDLRESPLFYVPQFPDGKKRKEVVTTLIPAYHREGVR